MIWKKKTDKTIDIATEKIDSVQLWIVEWYSRHGGYSGDIRKEYEAFTDEKVANAFAEDLINAFKLIRHTSGNRVTVRKN